MAAWSEWPATLGADDVIRFVDARHFLVELANNLLRGRAYVKAEGSYTLNRRVRVGLEAPMVGQRLDLDAVVVCARDRHLELELPELDKVREALDSLRRQVEHAENNPPIVAIEDRTTAEFEVPAILPPPPPAQATTDVGEDPRATQEMNGRVPELLRRLQTRPDSSLSQDGDFRVFTPDIFDLVLDEGPGSVPSVPWKEEVEPRYEPWESSNRPTSDPSVPMREEERPSERPVNGSPRQTSAVRVDADSPDPGATLHDTPWTAALPPGTSSMDPNIANEEDPQAALHDIEPLPAWVRGIPDLPTLPSIPARPALPTRLALPPPPGFVMEAFQPPASARRSSEVPEPDPRDTDLELACHVEARGLASLDNLPLYRATPDGILSVPNAASLLGLWLSGLRDGHLTVVGGPEGHPGDPVKLTLVGRRSLVFEAEIAARVGPWLTLLVSRTELIEELVTESLVDAVESLAPSKSDE